MDVFADFSSLLAGHMVRQGVGDARLETTVNNRFGHIVRISRSTVRNWKDGSSKSVADWRQIVAVAAVLNLSAVETEQLLKSAQLPSLTSLWTSALVDERELLEQWFEPSPVELIETGLTDIKAGLDQLIEDDKEILFQISQHVRSSAVERVPPSPPFILPQLEVPFFTGREEELEKLERLLLNSEGQRVAGIVGLTGTGGMGKSALAYHFAKIYRDRFPAGVIGLRVDGGQVDTIAARFAYHAGVEINPQKGLSASEIMQSVFSQKQALLIFDNAEDIAAQVLNPGGEKCAVIITTRNRSLLSNFGVAKTALVDLPRFECEETKRMLIKMLGEQRVLSEIEAVQDIHELVGGLPLALRIIGSFLADQSFTTLADYAAMLRNEKTRLSYLRDPDEPSLDVRASFELSLRYLDEEQIKLFAYFSVCAPEGFSLRTAQTVSDQDEATVRNSLGRLIRLSLVNEGRETKRFVLHPLLFVFARELAEEHDILIAAEQRHTEYFRIYAHEHRGLSSINLDALEREFDEVLLTARRLTYSQIPDYNFYFSIEPFLQSKGYWTQALDLIQLFLQIARDNTDYYIVTQLLLQQAQFLQLQGKFREAEDALREGEKTAYAIENSRQQQRALAMILLSLGGVYQRQGKFNEAIVALQQSYSPRDALGDTLGKAMVLNSLGGVYQRLGKFDEAVAALQQSYSFRDTLGDIHGKAMTLNSLGGVYQRQGSFVEAVDVFQQSYALLTELNDERGQAMALNSLGGAYQRLGKFDDAVVAFQKSHDLLSKLKDKRGQAMVLNSLGGVYQRQGSFVEAVDVFQQSYALLTELNDERGQAMALNSLGGAYQRLGKFDDAVVAFKQSASIEDEIGNKRGQAMVLNSLGGVYQRQGKLNEAAEVLEQSASIEDEIGNKRGQAMVLNSLGGVYQRQGKLETATNILQQSYAILVTLKDERGQAMVLNSLGGVYERRSMFDEAINAFKQSAAIEELLGNRRGQAMVYFSLGKALLHKHDYHQAVEKLKSSFEIDEGLRNAQGMRIITPSLVRTLTILGRHDEAQDYCARALTIAPLDRRLLTIQEQILVKRPVSSKSSVKNGHVKKLIRNYAGYLYGFITPDDKSEDVYFGENEVHPRLITILTEGIGVKAEVEQSARGPRARRVWQDEECT